MWIPFVLIGSLFYWTVALGLGGWSVSLLAGSSQEELALPGGRSASAVTLPSPASQTRDPIVVHIQSGSDLVSGVGGNHSLDDGTGRLPGIDESPPPPAEDSIGRTSY